MPRVHLMHHFINLLEDILGAWLGVVIPVGAIGRAVRMRGERYRIGIKVAVAALYFQHLPHHAVIIALRRNLNIKLAVGIFLKAPLALGERGVGG